MVRISYSYSDGEEINILKYISLLNFVQPKSDIVIKLFRVHKEEINFKKIMDKNFQIINDKSRNYVHYVFIKKIEDYELISELLSISTFEYPSEMECYHLCIDYCSLNDSINNNPFFDISKKKYKICIANYHDYIDIKIDSQYYFCNKENIDSALLRWEMNNKDKKIIKKTKIK